MALIKCENVSIGYEGQTVVRDLNFQINTGDYLCIVGENGSGKSTLVKSLLGLKGVESGRIVFGDGLKQNEIGYLPQQTDVQKSARSTEIPELLWSWYPMISRALWKTQAISSICRRRCCSSGRRRTTGGAEWEEHFWEVSAND